MDALESWLDQTSAFLWGGPTIVLLLATAAYLSFVLRGIQFRRLRQALHVGLLVREEPEAEGDISHFQALMLALGGSVGVGNLLGVAAALTAGGPGALLWLWVAGWLVMATRYAEGVLGVYYREPDRQGRMTGGPMSYLSRGVGGWFGRGLGTFFAIMAVLAALGVGSLLPGHVAAEAMSSSFSVPPVLTALVVTALVAVVLAGGIRSIGRTLAAVMPVAVAVCLLAGLIVIAVHAHRLDTVLLEIGRSAITADAATGGLFGAATREAVRWGMSHGVLSAGTGLGTGGIASAAARTRTATTQALVAMTQTFIDTVVVSAVFGLALLVTGAHETMAAAPGGTLTGTWLTSASIRPTLPPGIAGAIVSVGLAFFALTTILAWAHYGERSAEYLLGGRATTPFRVLFVGAVFAGGLILQLGLPGIAVAWRFSEVVSGAMVLPNLVGVLLLSGVVVRETGRSPETR